MLSLLAAAVPAAASLGHRELHDSVCTQPAVHWVDGLPLGNGDLGALAYGPPENLSFAINQTDVWDLRYRDPADRPEFTFANIKDAVVRKDEARYRQLVEPFESWYNDVCYPMPAPCGRLQIRLGSGYAQFQHALHLLRAVLEGSYSGELATVKLLSFVHATQPLLWVRLRGLPRAKPVVVSLNREGLTASCYGPAALPEKDVPKLSCGGTKNEALLTGVFPEGLRYIMALRALGAQAEWTTSGAESNLTITPSSRDVDLILTVAPTEKGAKLRLQAAQVKGYAALLKEHEEWWRRFWSQSGVRLPVDYLEQQWDMGLYMLGSTYRAGHLCPALFGLWCYDVSPAWHGDYHLDRNVELPFWGMYTSNHLELTEPFYKFYEHVRPRVRMETRRFFGWDGLMYGGTLDPLGRNLGGWLTATMWTGSSAWIAQHFWWGWRYSGDKAFLGQRAYPILRECADFYERFVTRDSDGKAVLFPTVCPETGCNLLSAWGTNSASDVALVKSLFRWTVEASRILGVDAERRPRWEEILRDFPDYPTHDGVIVDFQEYPERTLPLTDCLRVMPMWPTGDINLESAPDRLGLGRRTAASIGGWFTILAGAAARVGMGDLAARHLSCLRTLSAFSGVGVGGPNPEGGTRRIFPEHHGGVVGAIGEMLLQSCGEAIHVFPAVPGEWQEVSFSRLRAEGAFLVSAERVKGRTTSVEVLSERGQPCVLANPWIGTAWTVRAPSGKSLLSGDGDRIRFSTVSGQRYCVEPRG